MTFTAIIPKPPLDDLIERIWDCDAPALPNACKKLDRILPQPGAGLIINLAEDRTRLYSDDDERICSRLGGSVCSGIYTHSFLIDGAEQQRVMGVVFRPGSAGPFLREPLHRLSNRDVDLEAIAGDAARNLRQRLLEADDATQRLSILERWLRLRAGSIPARPPSPILHAMHCMHGRPEAARIGALIRDSGLSQKRFGRLFREHVGLGPKRYVRLLRFRQLIDTAYPATELDWAGLAVDCGFHDQPHLVREFRAFAGMTPGAYAAQRGPHRNHVPL